MGATTSTCAMSTLAVRDTKGEECRDAQAPQASVRP